MAALEAWAPEQANPVYDHRATIAQTIWMAPTSTSRQADRRNAASHGKQ
jgi:hypothetical protein